MTSRDNRYYYTVVVVVVVVVDVFSRADIQQQRQQSVELRRQLDEMKLIVQGTTTL